MKKYYIVLYYCKSENIILREKAKNAMAQPVLERVENSLDILNKFRIQHPEYETIKLTELHDFTDIVTSDGKLVILFEDVFGRTNTRFTENTDIQIIDRLQACLNQGNVKAILTKFNLRVISLNEDENYFKEEILKENIPVTLNHKTLYSIIESEPLLGFPEACSLFTRNRKLTRLGIKFFNHPSKHLYDEIDKIRKNGRRDSNDRLLYVTLVYLLLNGDVLDENSVDTVKGMDIMKSCYGSQQEILFHVT
ncbi:unnamed protein product [Mytilus edulis]|uniref:Novel STAND NTPase 3 domain-containing protein n=1 Tax=Mytilus edulis TaxID=6550 RepID=A0A8S3UJ84_MYTED|nr:unnamed protein product [Mytilus edulis]